MNFDWIFMSIKRKDLRVSTNRVFVNVFNSLIVDSYIGQLRSPLSYSSLELTVTMLNCWLCPFPLQSSSPLVDGLPFFFSMCDFFFPIILWIKSLNVSSRVFFFFFFCPILYFYLLVVLTAILVISKIVYILLGENRSKDPWVFCLCLLLHDISFVFHVNLSIKSRSLLIAVIRDCILPMSRVSSSFSEMTSKRIRLDWLSIRRSVVSYDEILSKNILFLNLFSKSSSICRLKLVYMISSVRIIDTLNSWNQIWLL